MRNFKNIKRIVVKVGTNVLSAEDQIDVRFITQIARQIARLVQQGHQVILVTSGAIGMGAGAMGIHHKVTSVKQRQAFAAIGQGILMHKYRQAFNRYHQQIAQVLLTNAIMSNRKYYVNLKNSVETLLSMGVVPVLNENDCVSIAEIDLAFGDNDKLSALVASKIDAELLIILTDVEGLYDSNPRKNRNAQMIPLVGAVTPEIEAMAGDAGSKSGTGGMKSKINAIKIASHSGCKVVLAHGRQNDVITRIVQGDALGTLFLPKRRLSNRKRWILNSTSRGTIQIDPGAIRALKAHRSLLIVGVTAVQGEFKAGDVVDIAGLAKGVTAFSASAIQKILANRSSATSPRETIRKAIVHANDIVLIS